MTQAAAVATPAPQPPMPGWASNLHPSAPKMPPILLHHRRNSYVYSFFKNIPLIIYAQISLKTINSHCNCQHIRLLNISVFTSLRFPLPVAFGSAGCSLEGGSAALLGLPSASAQGIDSSPPNSQHCLFFLDYSFIWVVHTLQSLSEKRCLENNFFQSLLFEVVSVHRSS